MLVETFLLYFEIYSTLSRIPAIFAHTCSRTYTVKAGDYCDKISQEQNVSTFVFALYGRFYPVLTFFLCHCRFQLAVVNLHAINKGCSNLTENQPLCLGTVGEDCSITHVVQPNDTCTDIAAQNNLNKTILYLNNPQLDESCDIYVGEVRVLFFHFFSLSPYRYRRTPVHTKRKSLQRLLIDILSLKTFF